MVHHCSQKAGPTQRAGGENGNVSPSKCKRLSIKRIPFPQPGHPTRRMDSARPEVVSAHPKVVSAHPKVSVCTRPGRQTDTFEFADTRSGILRAHAVHTFLAGRNLAESQSRAPGATRNLDFVCKTHGFHADVARRSKKATRRIAKCRFKSRPACQSKRPTLQNANVERRRPQPFTANDARRIVTLKECYPMEMTSVVPP